MKITAIKQQVKSQGRYSVFVDEQFAFGLSELGLINSGLRIGLEISKEELAKLKDDSAYDKLYNRVLNLLARRARSEWEIRDYLRRHDSPLEFIERILNKLSELGYVSDYEFAKSWVANRRLLKPTSIRKLQAELKQKRIADEVIHEVLGEDETDESEVLRDLVARKRKQTKYQDNQKLMQYLIRQGYNYGMIKEILEENND